LLFRADAKDEASLSWKSGPWAWWMELVSDDVRVDGARDGVALRDGLLKVDALFRSRTFRDKEGKLRSSRWVTLCALVSTDRRLLDMDPGQ
jgi:hypothetical protein